MSTSCVRTMRNIGSLTSIALIQICHSELVPSRHPPTHPSFCQFHYPSAKDFTLREKWYVLYLGYQKHPCSSTHRVNRGISSHCSMNIFSRNICGCCCFCVTLRNGEHRTAIIITIISPTDCW